ncbi:enoyl-CoA hydratase/isomerase family protein [Sphingobium estronivorans]|uniref:enoyl-CoA hydratase/isomerase family protein n=1 Tax=Sphingobium estronivorans TaxID=1577690 RepID=UPI00123B7368|nr:enoyl-CoA hydratase-related protein [Sphingobium estronivorans]
MSTLSHSPVIELVRSDGWLKIRLNRPESRNALNGDMIRELVAAFRAVRDDRSVRGISLRGNGGFFCAGGDLKMLRAIGGMEAGEARAAALAVSRDGADLFRLVREAPQPVVALIEGPVMAGGVGLASAADFAICTKDAIFSLSEAAVGLVPAQIAPYVVQRLGFIRGRQMMISAARIDAAEAVAVGLVDRMVEDAAALDAAEAEMMTRLRRAAPGAVASTKAMIDLVGREPMDGFIDRAAAAFADAVTGEEGREGTAAFGEGRKPAWAQA